MESPVSSPATLRFTEEHLRIITWMITDAVMTSCMLAHLHLKSTLKKKDEKNELRSFIEWHWNIPIKFDPIFPNKPMSIRDNKSIHVMLNQHMHKLIKQYYWSLLETNPDVFSVLETFLSLLWKRAWKRGSCHNTWHWNIWLLKELKVPFAENDIKPPQLWVWQSFCFASKFKNNVVAGWWQMILYYGKTMQWSHVFKAFWGEMGNNQDPALNLIRTAWFYSLSWFLCFHKTGNTLVVFTGSLYWPPLWLEHSI